MLKLAIAGATGRTGSAALRLAMEDDRFEVAAALTAPGGSDAGATRAFGSQTVTVTDAFDARCDVLIDFSLPAGTMMWLEYCTARKTAMVIGATGHDAAQLAAIEAAARSIPIVKASNFSVGITSILGFLGQLARTLGDAYDVELVESHHRHKVDAPSGTAITLADAITEATGRSREKHARYGRVGAVGERPVGEIGIHAVRMGEITGQHEIYFSGPGETITIRHTAHSRDTFASGALRAAAWAAGRAAGLYAMTDVLAE